MTALDVLRADRVLSVVRADKIPDAAALCHALAAGGIRTVELTFTTPGVLDLLRSAADAVAQSDVVLGVGTVLTADQARAAIDNGASFLVTPAVRPGVAEVALSAGVPVFLGALTPTEVAMASTSARRRSRSSRQGDSARDICRICTGPTPTSNSCRPAASPPRTHAPTSMRVPSQCARAPASSRPPASPPATGTTSPRAHAPSSPLSPPDPPRHNRWSSNDDVRRLAAP